jgi:hypothetical protein
MRWMINKSTAKAAYLALKEWIVKALEGDKPHEIIFRECSRSHDQNAKFHAMVSDIAKQMHFGEVARKPWEWKVLLISAHAKATYGEFEFVHGLEGEPVALRESTAEMSVARMSSLIEYVQAWGVQHGVKFSAKVDEFY